MILWDLPISILFGGKHVGLKDLLGHRRVLWRSEMRVRISSGPKIMTISIHYCKIDGKVCPDVLDSTKLCKIFKNEAPDHPTPQS